MDRPLLPELKENTSQRFLNSSFQFPMKSCCLPHRSPFVKNRGVKKEWSISSSSILWWHWSGLQMTFEQDTSDTLQGPQHKEWPDCVSPSSMELCADCKATVSRLKNLAARSRTCLIKRALSFPSTARTGEQDDRVDCCFFSLAPGPCICVNKRWLNPSNQSDMLVMTLGMCCKRNTAVCCTNMTPSLWLIPTIWFN